MKVIPRGEWDVRGTWKGVRKESGERSAILTCPDCGLVASLTDHGIAPDGVVTPSVICPQDGCAFHEWIRLDGWTA